jgi:hypothetical protein
MRLPRAVSCALPVCILAAVLCGSAFAKGVVVGFGVAGDSADGRAYSLFADIGITDKTWMSGTISRSQTNNDAFNLDAKFADLSLDHFFDPIGVSLGGSYWGDDGLLDSHDGHVSIYVRNKKGSIAAVFERREFDLTISFDRFAESRLVEFSANGYGLTGRWQASERTSLYASGMVYEYSRDIALQPDSDRLRFLSLSRFSLINSLLDNRLSGGVEFKFGLRRLDFRYSSWETAVVQGRVNSLGMGFLTPLGNWADMEFRLAYDDSEDFGSATVLSVFLYLYSE